ncbi:LacI family transcriptional regulator [Arsenicitalea aurantiaca]|uniref:LacI family transcriptional regulator n=1 Tax=Arsenicitalea aurantiaca TaxID=1783274 RepID=A0A433X2H9_9HYPH|nr:LacI family DNA-binding transcriptional regulator [Arsenicitalea aurantiaca]RUT28261.1 LacI family transcriptional regulator [Arsenicitalea aurantiaca]
MTQPRRHDRAVTIKDVAREADVSAMTVSNVLNGRGRVSEETAARIRAVVERLGYRPSMAARRLRLSRQWTIGMLIVVEDRDFLSDPFITAQVTGLTNYLTQNAYSLIVRGIRPSDFRTSGLFQQIEADGMVAILSGSEPQRQACIRQIGRMRLPTVLLQEQAASQEPDCVVLRQDDFAGGQQVARHLLETGARGFWMLIPQAEWPGMKARLAGVTAELQAAGLPPPTVVQCSDESYDVAYAATLAALEERGAPDAIVGGNDQLAIAAMKACQARGFSVPDDIQISGFNGFAFWRYVEPVLTTVISPAHLLGERAGELLIDRLQVGAFAASELVLPVTFQPGRSTRAHT